MRRDSGSARFLKFVTGDEKAKASHLAEGLRGRERRDAPWDHVSQDLMDMRRGVVRAWLLMRVREDDGATLRVDLFRGVLRLEKLRRLRESLTDLVRARE